MATYRNTSARSNEICATGRFVTSVAVNVRRTNNAAVTNHLSWMRSSPTAFAYRIATETNDTPAAIGWRKRTTTNSVSAKDPPDRAVSARVNGSFHTEVAKTTVPTRSSSSDTIANHSAGLHRRDDRRPVGKSRKRKGSMPTGIGQIAFAIHPRYLSARK